MGHPHFGPGGAVSRRTVAHQRYSLRYIAILDLDPAAKDGSHRTPERETLLGCHGNELVCPLTQGYVVSDERKQPTVRRQAHSQSRWMSQPPRLSDGGVASCQCLIRQAETEKDDPQKR